MFSLSKITKNIRKAKMLQKEGEKWNIWLSKNQAATARD